MLGGLSTEAQLAAILAHETAHIVARDSSAAMSREIGIGILLSAVTSDKTPQSVSTVANLTRQILGLQYSRDDEREADLAGLDYMVAAGYSPYGMIEGMQMLESQQRSRPIDFFSTHPSPENRIAYLEQKIQSSYSLAGLRVGKEDYYRYVLRRFND
jgi:predicted Zn-dependent protease